MIRALFDLANTITILGLTLTTLSFFLILNGQVNLALVFLMWAVMADHLDGYIARRRADSRDSYSAKIGADMDSFTDVLSGGVAPCLIAMVITSGDWYSLFAALFLIISVVLRASYFNNFGYASSGRFYGVPLTYNIPIIAFLFILENYIPTNSTSITVPSTMLILAVAHVQPFGPPPVKGIGFIIVFSYALLVTFLLN